MRTALDTNVLLDILTNDARYFVPACLAVSRAVESGPAVISAVVYAELAVSFRAVPGELGHFLRDLQLSLDERLPAATLEGAGRAWAAYLGRRGREGQCPQCGQPLAVVCPRCGRNVSWRQHILADFLIGAHVAQFTSIVSPR